MAKRSGNRNPLIFIVGGANCGKSRLAESLTAVFGRRVLYVATARAADAEMTAKIRKHRRRRPAGWLTVEALDGRFPVKLPADLDAILVDSLGLWVASAPGRAQWAKIKKFIETGLARAPVVVVSDEVGLGGVAMTPEGRAFAERLGGINQRLARMADDAYAVIAGGAVRLNWRQ